MKRILLIVILGIFLCGFASAEPACRVVTEVQVHYYDANGTILTRTYTQDAHMQSVLNYLRMLHPSDPVIPEYPTHTDCEIVLRYSSGPDSVFLQQDAAYLRRDNGPWKKIDETQTQFLYPLLLLLPSDP